MSESYSLISLSAGQVAAVSPNRVKELSRYRWMARWAQSTKSYYAYRNLYIDGRQYKVLMHRQILGLSHGDSMHGEHANCDTLDNRDENLRIANSSQNGSNRRVFSNNRSGYKGVCWDKKSRKWRSSIRVNYVKIHLGLFIDPKDAHLAYCTAARKHFGEFARAA